MNLKKIIIELAIIAFIFPLIILGIWSVTGSWIYPSLLPQSYSLRGFQYILSLDNIAILINSIILSILVVFILVFSMAIIYRYNVVTRTIVIDTTSTIKLDINGFNRVLNISSSTEKGAKLIEETNLLDQSIDTAIYKIIEYANENQMIKSTGIVVTVTGKELKHNSLEKTEDFIYRKNLKVRFNNSGLEHKVN